MVAGVTLAAPGVRRHAVELGELPDVSGFDALVVLFLIPLGLVPRDLAAGGAAVAGQRATPTSPARPGAAEGEWFGGPRKGVAGADQVDPKQIETAGDQGGGAPILMAATSDGFSASQRAAIDKAIRDAETACRYEFSVYVGAAEGATAAVRRAPARLAGRRPRAACSSWSTPPRGCSRWSPARRCAATSPDGAVAARRARDGDRLRLRRPRRRHHAARGCARSSPQQPPAYAGDGTLPAALSEPLPDAATGRDGQAGSASLA